MKDKLAIIVPFRDRQDHLDIFVPHMHSFLKDKGIDYTIFVAEQADDRPFNYGKLCNVVVNEISKEYTYFAFHDVDMLPINDDCDYGYPDVPIHLATQVQVHNYKLPYVQYFGGVVLINREDFEKANGYSNEYWGYGFSDLDLLYRLKESGAYLEKFYDLNKTYSNYNELDSLPYRIEDVEVSLNEKTQKLSYSTFSKESYLYGVMNKLTSKILQNSFSVSFWFNDDSIREPRKNLFSFEGSDTGVFLSDGNQLIFQIWDRLNNNHDIITPYFRNRWNHCVFSYDSVNKEASVYLNNIKVFKKLEESFNLFDYSNHCIKVSDNNSDIKISNILVYSKDASDEFVNELYYNGESHLDLIETKYGYYPQIYFKYDKLYRNNLLLDSGISNNHIKIYGTIKNQIEDITLTNEIFLPVRLEGKYNSLVHEDDTDIINRYYKYDPDIIENADIFFNEVLEDVEEFKKYGLTTLKYTILDFKELPNQSHYRIST